MVHLQHTVFYLQQWYVDLSAYFLERFYIHTIYNTYTIIYLHKLYSVIVCDCYLPTVLPQQLVQQKPRMPE